MPSRQTLRTRPCPSPCASLCPPIVPRLWLVTDARTETRLDAALRRLPRGAGVVFRHYHLSPAERAARFAALARRARPRGIVLVWAGAAAAARRHGADGAYGSPTVLGRGPATLRLVTVHSLRELAAAARARADAVLLSPVFPTRSHPGAPGLGPVRWRLIAARSPVPVIALGGMTPRRARRVGGHGWAAIDGLAAG